MNEKKGKRSSSKKLLFASLGIALLLIAGILALALSSAGRVRTVPTLCADDFFSGEAIEIPYRTKGLPHGVATSFQCEDLEAFAQWLPAKLGEDYEVKQFGADSLLIWQKKLPACYLILRQTNASTDSCCNFLLFDMQAVLGEREASQSFVFPYHLISLMQSQGTIYYRFDPAVSYETQYTKQDFLDFYRRLGQYTVAETKDGFQIMRAHGLSSSRKQQGRDAVTIPDRGLDAPVRFTFSQEGAKTFVRLSLPETNEA